MSVFKEGGKKVGHSEAPKRPHFPGCPLRGFQPSVSYPQATDKFPHISMHWLFVCAPLVCLHNMFSRPGTASEETSWNCDLTSSHRPAPPHGQTHRATPLEGAYFELILAVFDQSSPNMVENEQKQPKIGLNWSLRRAWSGNRMLIMQRGFLTSLSVVSCYWSRCHLSFCI